MKSLFKKSTYILSAAMLLFACGGKEAKKPTTVVETKTSKTKTLEIEKPQLTFGFIKLTDMAPLAIAKEKGFFEDEGFFVSVEAQSNS